MTAAKSDKAEKKNSKTIRVRQIRSGICTPKDQKATLRSLGFTKRGQVVVRPDDASIRGMILKVRHLVEIVPD